ncbi:TonB-dependent receptor plug domain-containing protein, partial [Mucilaginibacter sp.]|uniref:TonB-dependent receptor plug domain-containing protein n=1 Tax=Mucilaginibacter sp. TaxID=1882438 RepID=UPI002BCBD8AF
FIYNKENELKLGISPIQTTAHRTTLNITATDQNNKGKQGTFSVAVISESKVQPDENEESTIINNLLLTSELKGYIEQPNYYFTNTNEQTRAALDNLMLTQGYRRYEWKQIPDTASNTTIKYQPERSQEISGILTAPGGKPVPNGKVTLAAIKEKIFRDTTADEKGHFTFNNLYISDTTTLVLRARKANKGSNVLIKAIPPDYPGLEPTNNIETIANTDTLKAQQQYKLYQQEQKDYIYRNGKTLNTVTIKGLKKKKEPDLQFSSNLNGAGRANQVIMYDQLGNCIDLADCLNGKLLGVTFTTDGHARNLRSKSLGKSPNMSIIIDGITLDADNASLNDINPNDVYSIEVLRSGAYLAIYGSNAPGGALVITMKHGNVGTAYFSQTPPNGIVTIKYGGFHKTKAFYQPKYAPKADSPESARTTIYWNPNMLTDKDGNASLEYFTPDVKGTYRVVIEGIDDDGDLGRQVYKYEVK